MNFSRFRVLLQCSTTVSSFTSRELPNSSTRTFEKSNNILFPFARTYCSCTASVSSEEKRNPDNESEEYRDLNRMPIDYHTIAGNDPIKIKNLELILQEIDTLTLRGEKMPKVDLIKPKYWENLLTMKSKNIVHRYLHRLRSYQDIKEKRKLDWKKEVMQKGLEKAARNSVYGLKKNTIFHRIYPKQVSNLYNWKLIEISIYRGTDIIIDCSYEEFMSESEVLLSTKQLVGIWSRNRDKLNPFNITYCNLKPNGCMSEILHKILPRFSEPGFPFFCTESNYIDLFPKEKLVYLTPHGTEIMETYDPNSIYIMGSFVNKRGNIPMSLAKAKEHGLRTAKLPLDKYLTWQRGRKTLTIPTCLDILTELRDGKDWNYAFKHIYEGNATEDELDPEMKKKRDHRYAVTEIREQFRSDMLCRLLQKANEDNKEPTPA